MFTKEEIAVMEFVNYIVETGQLSGEDNKFLEEQVAEYLSERAVL